MNKVILHGRVASDPVERPYGEGKSFTTFSFAVKRNYKKNDKYETDFFYCIYSGAFTKVLIGKGQELLLEGRVEYNNWEKNGEKRRDVQIVVDNFDLCGPKPTETKPAPEPETYTAMGDDIPF